MKSRWVDVFRVYNDVVDNDILSALMTKAEQCFHQTQTPGSALHRRGVLGQSH